MVVVCVWIFTGEPDNALTQAHRWVEGRFDGWLTLTRAHVTTRLEKNGCFLVWANHTLFDLCVRAEKRLSVERVIHEQVDIFRTTTTHSLYTGGGFRLYYSTTLRRTVARGEAFLCTTLVLDWTCSLQMRHFLTRGEHSEQVAMWPHGPNSVSRFMSEHTIHSSRVSLLLFRDGLREPTCPLTDTGRERWWEEERKRQQGTEGQTKGEKRKDKQKMNEAKRKHDRP